MPAQPSRAGCNAPPFTPAAPCPWRRPWSCKSNSENNNSNASTNYDYEDTLGHDDWDIHGRMHMLIGGALK